MTFSVTMPALGESVTEGTVTRWLKKEGDSIAVDEPLLEDGAILPIQASFDSIVEAGKTRLRPVLLTAITTVLGLIPLAIGMNINFATLLSEFDPQFYVGGDNAAFWGPMAWTVIFGLTFATIITLVLVPVMYLLTDKLTIRLKRK